MTDIAESGATSRLTQPGMRSLVPFLLAALLLAALGAATTTPAVSDWFRAGPRSSWTPELTAVVLIWTTLDLLNGLAGWLIWRARARRSDVAVAFLLYGAQYVLQVLWLLAFMGQSVVAGGLLW